MGVPDIGNLKQEIKWIWPEKFVHSFPGQKHKYISEAVEHIALLAPLQPLRQSSLREGLSDEGDLQEADGIVMMDMHRCIGCRFCMAGCPYGARSFNWIDPRPFIKKTNPEFPTRMKGVVEKCTLCYERLAVGQIPACVEASNGGLVFGDLNDSGSELRKVQKHTYTIQRRLELGTRPSVFYVIGGGEHA